MTEYPLFRASEVLDMAIEVEHQGLAFYEGCVQSSPEARVGNVFEYLIDQENEHIRVFARMREGLGDTLLPESYPGEIRSYMGSFVKDQVFFEPTKAVEESRNITDPFKALEFAVEFEKRSILFYSGMKQMVPPSEGRVLDDVIAQEHEHIRRLLTLRRELER